MKITAKYKYKHGRTYPMLCPFCKRGYLHWAIRVFTNGEDGWVCDECRNVLAEDNPSEREKRSKQWERAWNEIMS